MKANVVTRVTIKAPVDTVFSYLSNLKRHYLWNPQLQKLSSQNNLKLGATYNSQSTVLGVKIRAKNTVTKFDPNREIQLENETGILRYKVNYRLRLIGSKTQLVCTTDVSSETNAFAFTVPILKLLARRELQADLQALKLAVEHNLS